MIQRLKNIALHIRNMNASGKTKTFSEIPSELQPTSAISTELVSLRKALINGLENPYCVKGIVLLEVCENEVANVTRISRNCWHLTIDLGKRLISDWSLGSCHKIDVDASIRLTAEAIHLLVYNNNNIDFRDPELMGHIVFSGKLSLVGHVARAMVSPSPSAIERLNWATHRTDTKYDVTDIERIEHPTEFEILKKLGDGMPFIIVRNATYDKQPTWTLNDLRDKFSNTLLRVRSADWKETVGEFIDRIELSLATRFVENPVDGFTKVYTEGCALPEAMKQYFLPYFFTLDDYIEPQIWLGSVSTDIPASSLHRDPLDGFLYQLIGRKKILMYSPDQMPFLYPVKAWNNYQACWVKPENPRLDLFPDFSNAHAIEVTLHPGEILVQPAGWFHVVSCLDSPTFSISYFYAR